MKKVVLWVLIVFLGFWLVTDPRGLADSSSSAGSGIWSGAEQLFGSAIDFAGQLG